MQTVSREQIEKNSTLRQTVARVINGAFAGVVGTIAIFPLDLCKTRLQQQSKTYSGSYYYKNVFDCMFKILKNDGIFGLYRGLAVNLTFVMPEKAIKLCMNDQLRYSFGSRRGSVLPLTYEMIAGGFAGTCQIIVTTPMEFLKIQMQMANKCSKSSSIEGSGAFKLALNLIQKDGILSIYRGLTATFLRDVTFSLMYFPGFAILNNRGFTSNGNKPQFYHTLGSGLISGCLSAFLVTPLDVVKTRLQFIDTSSNKPLYSGIVDCIGKTFRNDGLRTFFRGAVPRMIVIAPLFGIAQMVYFFGIGEKILFINKKI